MVTKQQIEQILWFVLVGLVSSIIFGLILLGVGATSASVNLAGAGIVLLVFGIVGLVLMLNWLAMEEE